MGLAFFGFGVKALGVRVPGSGFPSFGLELWAGLVLRAFRVLEGFQKGFVDLRQASLRTTLWFWGRDFLTNRKLSS